MTEPAYSVTPFGQDIARTSGRRPGVVMIGERTLRSVDTPPPPPRTSRRRPAPRPPQSGAVELSSVPIVVLRAALALADGDPRRLVLNADGSVTVTNGRRS